MTPETRLEVYTPAGPIAGRRKSDLVVPAPVIEPAPKRDLLAYWRVLRQRRSTIFAVVFAVFAVVLIGTLREKPVYQARALVEIEKENPSILTVQELFELENVSDSYLETQYKILRSTALARRVAQQLRLDQYEEFNPPPGWWPWRKATSLPGISENPWQTKQDRSSAVSRTIRSFERRLGVDPVRRSRLVEVSFESRDPALAAQIVNVLVASYIDQSLQLRWEAAQRASSWLSQQLIELKAKLEKSEDDLHQYAQSSGLLYLESDKGNSENIVDERLRQLQEELTKAQADRYQRESLYRLVLAGDYSALPAGSDDKLLQELTLRLSDLESSQAQLTATFSADYPKVKQIHNQIEQTESILAAERKRAASRITNDFLAAVRREALLRQAFQDQQNQANDVAGKSVQYNILKREVDTNRQLYQGLLERMKEAGVSAGLKASNIRLVDSAELPHKPARPNIPLNLAMALIVGLGVGIGAAFLQQHLDNTLKSTEDIEQYLNAPALALIPAINSLNGHRRAVYGAAERGTLNVAGSAISATPGATWFRIDALGPQYSALGEAFRGLRTSVLLSTAGQPPRSLLISSPQPGDGKTTVAANLAISLAQLGERVLLMDCDLRRPCLHRLFAAREPRGIVSYLTGQQPWRAAVISTGVPGLDALFCGPVPPSPAELLSSDKMRQLVREALEEYAFVLLDSPPMLSVADARILATRAEGVILVAKAGATPRELVHRARSHARAVGGNVIGIVLNNLDLRLDGYYYRYYRGYEHLEAENGERN